MMVRDLQLICKKYKKDPHYREQIDALDPDNKIADFSGHRVTTIWTLNELNRIRNIILDAKQQIIQNYEMMKTNSIAEDNTCETP